MQPTRSLGALSVDCYVGRDHRNGPSYVNQRIARDDPAETARNISEDVRKQVLALDLKAVDLQQLDELAANLYWEGFISEDAFAEIGLLGLDHHGPVDVLALMRKSLDFVRNARDADYSVAIRMYEATIAAVEGMQTLSEYLKGHSIDVEA